MATKRHLVRLLADLCGTEAVSSEHAILRGMTTRQLEAVERLLAGVVGVGCLDRFLRALVAAQSAVNEMSKEQADKAMQTIDAHIDAVCENNEPDGKSVLSEDDSLVFIDFLLHGPRLALHSTAEADYEDHRLAL